MKQQLSVRMRELLTRGRTISATLVALWGSDSATPEILWSDYVAAIEVQPLENGDYRIVYREIPETMLRYGYEWDRYATVNEEFFVKTMEGVEKVLARYVPDFSLLVAGSNMYASA